MEKKKWYYQREIHNNGYQPGSERRTAMVYEFWDIYLHAGCELIRETEINPFEK